MLLDLAVRNVSNNASSGTQREKLILLRESIVSIKPTVRVQFSDIINLTKVDRDLGRYIYRVTNYEHVLPT